MNRKISYNFIKLTINFVSSSQYSDMIFINLQFAGRRKKNLFKIILAAQFRSSFQPKCTNLNEYVAIPIGRSTNQHNNTVSYVFAEQKKKNHHIFSPLTEQKSDQRWIAWIQTNAHLLCVRTFFVFKMYVKAQQQQNSNLWVFLILEFSEVHFCMELKYG